MIEALWGIPPSWVWAKIEDAGRVVSGGTPSTKEPSFWGEEVVWFSPADLTGYREKYVARGAKSLSRKGLSNNSARLMPRGVVMFSSRAPIGYVAITSVEAATNQGFKSILPDEGIFNEYLYYYLKAAKQLAEERAMGTTFKEISGSAFATLPVPMAPSAEQRRIVAKIEELFSELDKGVESLTTAREQLKAFRQSVLKHAFNGNATSTWRERNGGAQWGSITIGEASERVVDCLHSTPRFATVGKYCVDLTWVEDNKLLWDQARYVDEATYLERIRRLKPERGDVILVREGSKKIGTALAINFDDDFCLGQRMMMFRLRGGIQPQYFAYYVQSDNFKKQYKPLIGGSASPHLNISDIKRMRLPLCSLEEQKEVVAFIDIQSSVLDALEATIGVELEKSQALRQSILKRAFSGQLVEQDLADEPASELLERIRAGRERDGATKRRNNKNGNEEAV